MKHKIATIICIVILLLIGDYIWAGAVTPSFYANVVMLGGVYFLSIHHHFYESRQTFTGSSDYPANLEDVAKRVLKHMPENADKPAILQSLSVFDKARFNRCWVAEYIPYWYAELRPRVNKHFVGRNNMRYLQIGVFEGLSLLYMKSIVEAPMQITVIDNFSTEPYFNTEETFAENTNISSFTRKTADSKDMTIRVIKKDSHSALLELITAGEKFDFVYCSGSRRPDVCFVDFALLTKVIGADSMILLDTYYAWSSYHGETSPDKVRDAFIEANALNADVADIGKQKLLTFHAAVEDNYVAREKPPDCVNLAMRD